MFVYIIKDKTMKTSVAKFEYFLLDEILIIFCNNKFFYVRELIPQTEGECILPLNSMFNFVLCMYYCIYLVYS